MGKPKIAFVTMTLDKLVELYVGKLPLKDGERVQMHRYWYDLDKGEIVIQVQKVDALEGDNEQDDEDDGEGGIAVRHRSPRPIR